MANYTKEELAKTLPPLYSSEKVADPMVPVKLFQPWGSWTWYLLEFDGDDTLFVLADGFEAELGYQSLKELMEIRGPGGLQIEKDEHWEPKLLSKCQEEAKAGRS